MEFLPQVFDCGHINADCLQSPDKAYTVHRYTYHQQRGWCTPYWVGYKHSTGERLTDEHPTSKQAITQLLRRIKS